jgi:hypothetical protein
MSRSILRVLSALWVAAGATMLAAPISFYRLTPGVAMMGPYNVHFIRDVGLAFFASGCVTLAGTQQRDRALVIAGAAWPGLHALFHIQIWAHRGFPFDRIAGFDATAVVIPAVLAVILARQLPASTLWSGQELIR